MSLLYDWNAQFVCWLEVMSGYDEISLVYTGLVAIGGLALELNRRFFYYG